MNRHFVLDRASPSVHIYDPITEDQTHNLKSHTQMSHLQTNHLRSNNVSLNSVDSRCCVIVPLSRWITISHPTQLDSTGYGFSPELRYFFSKLITDECMIILTLGFWSLLSVFERCWGVPILGGNDCQMFPGFQWLTWVGS